jgi:GTPase SAR1 family protein
MSLDFLKDATNVVLVGPNGVGKSTLARNLVNELERQIYAGRFPFAGKVVACDGRSPFEMEPPSDEWADVLLGFGSLRHLRAADSTINRANARALVYEWISLLGNWQPVAWQPEIVARRTSPIRRSSTATPCCSPAPANCWATSPPSTAIPRCDGACTITQRHLRRLAHLH